MSKPRSPTDATAGPTGRGADQDAPAADDLAWLPLYRILVQDAQDLHVVVDADGRCLFANRAAETLLGEPAEQVIGRSLFELVHPDDLERTRITFDEWVRRGSARPIRFENRLRSREGTVRELAWTVYPRLDEAGAVQGFAASGRDVSDRRRIERALRESEAVHRALLDGLLDPVVAIDDHGIIQRVSRAVEPILGYRPDELIGRNVALLMPEPHRSEHDSYLERFRRTGVTTVVGTIREFQVLRKDGGLIDVELSIAEVEPPAHGRPMFVGCFRDVTDRKRARRAEESMLRALAAIGESSAMLAHEIKNPITAVNMALRAVASSLGEDEQEVLQDLVRRMKRLEQQMRQTLAFAKPLELRRSHCDPRQLFEGVVSAQRPILQGARVEVDLDVPAATPPFDADALRMDEVITNLLINAVEMLGEGGRVRLSARAESDDHVALRVEDDGPGIASSVGATLFRPFVTTKSEGTGLGLPICRRIVEEHGGSIEVEEHGDLGGASFLIRMPVDGPEDKR